MSLQSMYDYHQRPCQLPFFDVLFAVSYRKYYRHAMMTVEWRKLQNCYFPVKAHFLYITAKLFYTKYLVKKIMRWPKTKIKTSLTLSNVAILQTVSFATVCSRFNCA